MKKIQLSHIKKIFFGFILSLIVFACRVKLSFPSINLHIARQLIPISKI